MKVRNIQGYKVTDSLEISKQMHNNPEELSKQLQNLYHACKNPNNKGLIDKLKRLIEKYPSSPQLKNYLSMAYRVREQYDKSKEVNDALLLEHPDYLFAKLNRANEYLNDEEFEKVLEILGKSLDLRDLYPERDVFHESEMINFSMVALRYYCEVENIEKAKEHWNLIFEVNPDCDIPMSLKMSFLSLGFKGFIGNDKFMKHIVYKPIPESNKEEAPIFIHPEVEELYQWEEDIPQELIDQIKALPFDSLVEDLEKILLDAVERYNYFQEEDEEEQALFVMHAINLLAEIGATKSLPKIAEFLEYEDDFVSFWIGEFDYYAWEVFYRLAFDDTTLLKELMLRPCYGTCVKNSASNALAQILLYNPERRTEVLNIYSDVLKFYAQISPEDNLKEGKFLGSTISDIMDCRLVELLPLIKILCDKDCIDTFVCGVYEDIKKELENGESDTDKRKRALHDSLFEIYQFFLDDEYDDDYEDEYDDERDYKSFLDNNDEPSFYTPIQPAVSTKIGRNEPCPCGSGKKYKKCCIGN